MSPLAATATSVGMWSPSAIVVTLPVAGLILRTRPLAPKLGSSGPPGRLVTYSCPSGPYSTSVGTASTAYFLPTVHRGRWLAPAAAVVTLSLTGLRAATVEKTPVGEIATTALAPASATQVT